MSNQKKIFYLIIINQKILILFHLYKIILNKLIKINDIKINNNILYSLI